MFPRTPWPLIVILGGCASDASPTTATLVVGSIDGTPEASNPRSWIERLDLEDDSGPHTLLFWSDEAAEEAAVLDGLDVSRRFELPVRIDDPSDGVPGFLTIVTLPAPWYASRSMIIGAFHDREAEYIDAPGLPVKHFLLTRGVDRRELGGIYLWTDEDAAAAWYDAAWHADIEQRYGESARVDGYTIVGR